MKIIAIGDIHGRNIWETLVSQIDLTKDKLIFIGDYFDSFTINGYKQLENFRKILKLKEDNPNNVILLLGNHDYHYLEGVNESYSGYQSTIAFDIQQLLNKNLNFFKICHLEDKFLFSHAGISRYWLQEKGIKLEDINDYLKYNYKIFGFHSGIKRNAYGDEPCQGPLWIRPNSLSYSYLENYIHVVGHTHQPTIQIEKNIILIDTLDHQNQYLVIENNKPYAKNIN